MLIVQKYHSVLEIDPEFITSIEVLLKEEVPNFKALVKRHDEAPSTDVFTYFLFFGPTQNTPIGFAQLTLRKIPSKKYLPWWRRLMFWKKDHHHWKEAIWKCLDGSAGYCVFDPKYARNGKEKVHGLIKEYQSRIEVRAEHIHSLKGLQDYRPANESDVLWTKETYIIEPMAKASKTYQDYLSHLTENTQADIKNEWKHLHKVGKIELGDYPTVNHLKKSLPLSPEELSELSSSGNQILTFEKEDKILGCLSVAIGKDGNVFFEPFPFESAGTAEVGDELYIQYALLKFFEMPDSRRCHLLKHGEKMRFDDKTELSFFLDQGFQAKTVVEQFTSNLPGLDRPL